MTCSSNFLKIILEYQTDYKSNFKSFILKNDKTVIQHRLKLVFNPPFWEMKKYKRQEQKPGGIYHGERACLCLSPFQSGTQEDTAACISAAPFNPFLSLVFNWVKTENPSSHKLVAVNANNSRTLF